MAEDIIRSEENVDVEGIGSRISDDIGQIIEHSMLLPYILIRK